MTDLVRCQLCGPGYFLGDGGCRHTGADNVPPLPPDTDGPECSVCGKTSCPDADLPEFTEPVNCAYRLIYDAIRDAKDCDYGCSRGYSSQTVALWMVPAIEEMLKAARAESYELGLEMGRKESNQQGQQTCSSCGHPIDGHEGRGCEVELNYFGEVCGCKRASILV